MNFNIKTYILTFVLLAFLNNFNQLLAQDDYHLKTIVIDAGHGGKDSGCLGASAFEKEITLNVALKLGDYIKNEFPNLNVVYTRKTDVFVELHERSAIANKNEADLFISIHCNSSGPNKHVHGTETYVMGLNKSNANLDVAKRENAVIFQENNYKENYNGFDPNSPSSHIMFSLFQNVYREQSILFADLIENQFAKRAGRKSRGVKEAGFLVLFNTAAPSVLVESGFLSNNTEEDFLRSDYGQSIIASAIYRAFKEYKIEVEYGNPNIIEEQKILIKETPYVQDESITTNAISTKNNTKVKVENLNDKNKIIVKTLENVEHSDSKKVSEYYRIQIFASKDLKDFDNLQQSKSLKNVIIELANSGYNKYLIGKFFRYDEAKNHLKKIRAIGFKDAFVVSYKDNKRL